MTDEPVGRIRENYYRVIEAIGNVVRRVQRNPQSVRLVVVTKLQPVELIDAAYLAGARFFGENYAEEALPKIQALSHLSGIEWHMIGHVQGRKARLVYENFSLVHSVDSLRLAERFEVMLAPVERTLPVLLEFNLSGEDSKSGWPAWNDQEWEGLLPELSRVLALPHLRRGRINDHASLVRTSRAGQAVLPAAAPPAKLPGRLSPRGPLVRAFDGNQC